MDSLLPVDTEDGGGTLRPLSSQEVRELLGTDLPGAGDFETAHDSSGVLGVADVRWSGRYTVLYRDGRPDELAFWGISSD